MGDVSIIARRLGDGHVQYGWSGNGGYYRKTGRRLKNWYQNPEDVEYLFGLGQTSLIGKKGSEEGGYSWFASHDLTGKSFWIGSTENDIYSKIMFIDYVYFYDLDHRWYYVIPGLFSIKMPIEFIENHLDKDGYEFDYRELIEDKVVQYILTDFGEKDEDFKAYLEKEGFSPEEMMENIRKNNRELKELLYDSRHEKVFDYFEDWVLIKTDDANEEITDIVVKKKEEKHVIGNLNRLGMCKKVNSYKDYRQGFVGISCIVIHP